MIPGAGIFRTKLPQGFSASGINCGVRRYRPDLGMILSDKSCVAVGVFTQNRCQAPCVQYCQALLPANNIKAIITNSGQANAATGKQGFIDNQQMANALAETLACKPDQVLTASTGVIGEALAIKKITHAIPTLVNSCTTIAENFATAILTTDLVPKTVYKEVTLSGGSICITGICKGSGMIHPNMATMLGYLLSDVTLTIAQAQKLLGEVCDNSFNMISVDGETSTNDSVFMLANGASGITLANDDDYNIFKQALQSIAITLAKSIARDGEGATKLMQIHIQGAATDAQARSLARALTTSPLLKTAIYGASPNWGRILARLGMHATEDVLQCDIHIQDTLVFSSGQAFNTDVLNEKNAARHHQYCGYICCWYT